MQPHLLSLVKALPVLADRDDSIAAQVADLIIIAQKLGMQSAAQYLATELNHHRMWHGPKPLHPEQQKGEVFLGNSKPDVVRYIGWKSKRVGMVAFNWDGKPLANQVPVFVSAEELREAGQLKPRDTVA
jgi:hypothetical protein